MPLKIKFGIVGLALAILLAVDAQESQAQCCGYGVPTVAYRPVYQTAYYQTAYQPATYTTYRPYSGWYPGYWFNRARLSLWGRTTYRPVYSAYAASYSPTYAYSPVSACSTCRVPTTTFRQVTLRPVCATACSPCCDPCSTPSYSSVVPATYNAPSDCAGCGVSQQAPMSAPPQGVGPARSYPESPQSRPALGPTESAPTERTFNKPSTEDGPLTPEPEDYSPSDVGSNSKEESSTWFQPPKLFNPRDRTASQVAAPVWNAVYRKRAASRTVAREISTRQTPHEQVQQDAIGWTSAAN